VWEGLSTHEEATREVRKLYKGHAGLSLLCSCLWDWIILFPSPVLSLKTRRCPAFQCPPPGLCRCSRWMLCQEQHPQPAAGLAQPWSSSALPTGYQTPGSPSSRGVPRVQPTQAFQVPFLLFLVSFPIFSKAFDAVPHSILLEKLASHAAVGRCCF